MSRVAFEKKVLSKNDEIADRVRDVFERRGVLAINLIGSPGCGKTTLVEKTATWARSFLRAAALSGDQATDNDAQRIRAAGIPALQITTGNECHLNAQRILDVLDAPELGDARLLLIENVGNLICPAAYDLGEASKVAMLSVPEGDDKPVKYPGLFQRADLMLITKMDLYGFSDFNLDRAFRNALEVAPHIEILPISCKSGEGLRSWFGWVEHHFRALGTVRHAR